MMRGTGAPALFHVALQYLRLSSFSKFNSEILDTKSDSQPDSHQTDSETPREFLPTVPEIVPKNMSKELTISSLAKERAILSM